MNDTLFPLTDEQAFAAYPTNIVPIVRSWSAITSDSVANGEWEIGD